MGRLLITIGILFVVIGLLWSLAPISSHWGICRGTFRLREGMAVSIFLLSAVLLLVLCST